MSVEGIRVQIANFTRGIFKPAPLESALSIFTAPPRAGRAPAYDDHIGESEILRYHYQSDPNHSDNRALRRTLELQQPIVYLYGIDRGVYLPFWPAYVVKDDRKAQIFDVNLAGVPVEAARDDLAAEAPDRRYRSSVVRRRVHQARFRQMVLKAYRETCAVCRLKRPELVDAAHIIGDADEGRPTVNNGLALCKLHHAAFDRHLLGINDDLRVIVRGDVLNEQNGPMLRHGLQEVHGGPLHLPRRIQDRPHPDFVARRWERFRAES